MSNHADKLPPESPWRERERLETHRTLDLSGGRAGVRAEFQATKTKLSGTDGDWTGSNARVTLSFSVQRQGATLEEAQAQLEKLIPHVNAIIDIMYGEDAER